MRRSFRGVLTALAIASIGILTAPAPGRAADSGEYFKGKTIRILVDTAPGGGTDLLARYFADKWPKFIPGHPRMIVSNYPITVAAMNYMWKVKPDGLTIIYAPRPRIPEQYSEQADFRVGDFQYIGGVHKSGGVWIVSGDVPYENIADASGGEYQLSIPVTPDKDVAVTQWNEIGPLLAADALNLKLRAIPLTSAERGTTEQLLGLERGDFDGFMRGAHVWKLMTDLRPGWSREGKIKPFAFVGTPKMSMEPSSETPVTAPNIYDLVDEKYRELLDAFVMAGAIPGKHFAAPPGLPDSILQIFRKAYDDAMKDETFKRAYVRIAKEDPPIISGAEFEAEVKQYATAFEKNKDRMHTVLQEIYEKYTNQNP